MPLKWTKSRPVASARSANHSACGGLLIVDARDRSGSARQPANGATQKVKRRTKNAPCRIRMRSVGLSHQVRVNTVKNRLTRRKQAVRWAASRRSRGHFVWKVSDVRRRLMEVGSVLRLARTWVLPAIVLLLPAAAHAQSSIAGNREGCVRRGAARRHRRSGEPGADRESPHGGHRRHRPVPHRRSAARAPTPSRSR